MTSPATPLLELRHVTRSLGGRAAVADVSFAVEAGATVGLAGPNGSGGSTLLDCISGFQRPDRGEIRFRGRRLEGLSPDRICRRGLVRTWRRALPVAELSVLDAVATGALTRTRRMGEARDQALEQLRTVGLDHRAGAPAAGLSAGERKRLEVARALATRPGLLLLDEVTAGLEPAEVDQVIELLGGLRSAGLTLLLLERDVPVLLRSCDRLIVLDAGEKLAEGTPADVARDPTVVRAFLGEAR